MTRCRRTISNGTRFRMIAGTLVLLAAGLLIASFSASAQEARELRIAHFAAPTHPLAKWLEAWAKDLEKKSGGKLKFTIIPGAQLGPITKYYDIARRGQADITWMLHGGTPNRFPLTEISNLPFMFCSGAHATLVLNNPELRAKYLDAEHEGLKVLNIHAHVPGQIWMANKPIRKIEDFAGAAIRPASRTIGAFVNALGAKSVGMPPNELAENMQKGTLDGTFMDYVAGAFAFKLGPVTKYITEMYSYTASLAIVMNEDTWNGLSDDMKKLITDSMAGREKDIGGAWDKVNLAARGALVKGGTEIVKMNDEEFARLKKVGEKVAQDWVKALDERGLPGSKVYAMMKKLVDETRDDAQNFCTQ